MALYCGTDIIEISRIKKSMDGGNNAFRDRVYTKSEIDYCEKKGRSRFQSYAVRFAAKEAVVKAFGTGIGSEINFRDIEVKNDSLGKPDIELNDKAKEFFEKKHGRSISVSLSHCENYGVAFVIIETDE
jgi:holo-[acyl-carrier protein] synthase